MPLAVLLSLAVLGGCSHSKLTPPSLAPRAAEAIDPRLPVENRIVQRPVGSAMAVQLAGLLRQARSGDEAFRAAIGPAERAVSAAGAPQSESWISAQLLVSAAQAARAPTTRALSDIDALAGTTIKAQGGIGSADLAAINAATAEVGAMDERQGSTLRSLSARLGR